MVDAGSDFAIPFYSGEPNVAVGASSTPIHVAAIVVQIGRGHWLFQESLHPRFPSPYTNPALKTTRSSRIAPVHPVSARRIMLASCDFRYGLVSSSTPGSRRPWWTIALSV